MAGGRVAYELEKVERDRREVQTYDISVAPAHRRMGLATALIEEQWLIAGMRGADAVLVRADPGDDPAIQLYGKSGSREDVLHLDAAVRVRLSND